LAAILLDIIESIGANRTDAAMKKAIAHGWGSLWAVAISDLPAVVKNEPLKR